MGFPKLIPKKAVLLGSGALVVVAAIVVATVVVTTPRIPINPDIHIAGTTAGTVESQGERMSAEEIAKAKAEIKKNAAEIAENPSAAGPDVSNTDPAPVAQISGTAADDTARLMDGFGQTVTITGQRVLDAQPSTVEVTTDQCLVDWAVSALPSYDGTTFMGLVEVCGTTAAVFAAGPRMDGRTFAGRAAENPAAAAVRDALFGKAALQVGAAATPDRNAVIMVATSTP